MTKLPFLAVVLMLASVLPFVGCACGILFFDSGVPTPNLMAGLELYAAISLSFLGAVHWGQALEGGRVVLVANAGRVDTLRLALGVVPALMGWFCASVAYAWGALPGLALFATAFAITALGERQAWRRGWLPAGYMGVRWIMTAVTECCLLMVLLARAF